VLAKAPGININYSDVITMRGKSGVMVLIDGKQVALSAADLANYLKAMPSSNVERIEIITTPPAKYDAAGNAGIIDIRLKKDQRFGMNGNVNGNYGQGVYPKAGVGLGLNYRLKKINVFGNTNYSYRKGLNKLNLYREFFENFQRTGAYDQQNYLIFPFNFYTLRGGMDYYINQGKTIIGFVASNSANRFNPEGFNNSNVENENREKISSFTTSNHSKDYWPNYSINLNGKHRFDSSGTELNIDLDYAKFSNTTEQNFLTKYYDLQNQPLLPDYYLYGDLKGSLSIQSVKIDFSKNIFKKIKFESGIKSSFVKADNDLAFFDKSDVIAVYDSTKSNHFLYNEQIHAAYTNFQWEWKKVNMQTGLRVEQTLADGIQLVNGQTFKKDYIDLFPTISANYNFSENYIMGVNINRRLDRPNYKQLNPFKFFLDPSTYKEGNPFLNPQFSWNFEWNHQIQKNYSLAFAYSVTTDNITEVIGPAEGLERVTVQTDQNLSKFENFSVTGSAQIDILKNWSSLINVNVWQGFYQGQFANTELSDSDLAFGLSCNNSFQFSKGWSAEMNFEYQSPQVYGFMKLNAMYGLNLGLQKSILNKKATLKLSATDIFWTNLPSANIYYRDYFEYFDVKRETRVVSLSFNYKFGNNKISASRKRNGGAEEEKRRAEQG
jgi:hypothetical protein